MEKDKKVVGFKPPQNKTNNRIIPGLDLNSVENKQIDWVQEIDKIKTDPQDIRDFKVEWIISHCIAKGTITMYYGPSGIGKSWASLFTGVWCLKNKKNTKITRVIYIDADNGLVTLNDRKIDRLISRLKALKYIAINTPQFAERSGKNADEFIGFYLLNLSKKFNKEKMKRQMTNTLIVIDSIRDFLENMIDKVESKNFMKLLKKMRDEYHATVLFINHTPKIPEGKPITTYSGASDLKDSIDTAYQVVPVDADKENLKFMLKMEKARIGGQEFVICIKPKKFEVTIEVKNETNK